MTCSIGMVWITIYSQMACKTSLVAFRPTFQKSSLSSKSVSLTSVRGTPLKCLQLNARKMEILWFGSARNL